MRVPSPKLKLGVLAAPFLLALIWMMWDPFSALKRTAVASINKVGTPGIVNSDRLQKPASQETNNASRSGNRLDIKISAMLSELNTASTEECIRISDELVNLGSRAEPYLITALDWPETEDATGVVANVLARIGSRRGIESLILASAGHENPALQATMLSGLSGLSTPAAAKHLAYAALASGDTAVQAHSIEHVARLADSKLLLDLMEQQQEQIGSEDNHQVLDQMICSILQEWFDQGGEEWDF
jgi:hypothetical protein